MVYVEVNRPKRKKNKKCYIMADWNIDFKTKKPILFSKYLVRPASFDFWKAP